MSTATNGQRGVTTHAPFGIVVTRFVYASLLRMIVRCPHCCHRATSVLRDEWLERRRWRWHCRECGHSRPA